MYMNSFENTNTFSGGLTLLVTYRICQRSLICVFAVTPGQVVAAPVTSMVQGDRGLRLADLAGGQPAQLQAGDQGDDRPASKAGSGTLRLPGR